MRVGQRDWSWSCPAPQLTKNICPPLRNCHLVQVPVSNVTMFVVQAHQPNSVVSSIKLSEGIQAKVKNALLVWTVSGSLLSFIADTWCGTPSVLSLKLLPHLFIYLLSQVSMLGDVAAFWVSNTKRTSTSVTNHTVDFWETRFPVVPHVKYMNAFSTLSQPC